VGSGIWSCLIHGSGMQLSVGGGVRNAGCVRRVVECGLWVAGDGWCVARAIACMMVWRVGVGAVDSGTWVGTVGNVAGVCGSWCVGIVGIVGIGGVAIWCGGVCIVTCMVGCAIYLVGGMVCVFVSW
jgi:hypothetical protein